MIKKSFLTFTILFLLLITTCFADIGWYICPYKRVLNTPQHIRYCAMDDYTKQIIYQDKGNWSETEVLGNRAIVKVKASASTLAILDGVFKRIPKNALNLSLSDLTTTQKNFLKNEALDMGYSLKEINVRLPNPIGTYTLRDVLGFFATRRLKPRYDVINDTIVCDGIEQPVREIGDVDNAVK